MASTINFIRDVSNNIVDSTLIKVEKITAKYSNTKTPIFKIIINDIPISRNNNYYINYKCPSCSSIQEITLNLFCRRLNNNSSTCPLCKNNDEYKKQVHSEFMKQNFTNISKKEYTAKKKLKEMTFEEKLKLSNKEFINEDDDYKQKYFLHHLSFEEFDRIKTKIVGISNNKINGTELDKWMYYPHFKIGNQTKYNPILYNIETNVIEKPLYISYNCEGCDNIFTNRDLEVQKNKIKIYCQDCLLSNKIFKIRHIRLKNGNKIKYQSNPEKKFIEWCEEEDILIQNGPAISYNCNDKKSKYYVDFELPELKMLIEIKDNHIWHKMQIKNGKWGKKELAAIEWSKFNNYKYEIIYPKTLSKIKEMILFSKQSLKI
jgi:hypothetical protein